MGYRHVMVYDHVLGADPGARPGWKERVGGPPYTHETMFHEIFVLLGYLAAVTTRVQLITGVLILPQRQTALVAKQAAEVDVLSGGRLILGVGNGWNDVEHAGMGMDFHTRGKRLEEQIAVLRALWAQGVVTFHGEFHDIEAAGINPLPVQRPIPVWFGGYSEAMAKRAARLADGLMGPDPTAVAAYARETGRDVSSLGVRGAVRLESFDLSRAADEIKDQEAAGVTHCTLNAVEAGYAGVDQHIDVLRQFKEASGAQWR